MPVSLVTRAKREMVTLLSNVDVGFVSLVKHGANWTPFTAIKTDSGDSGMAGQVIQSILMPAEADLGALREAYGEEWFNRVKTEDAETLDHFVRFTQRGEDEFNAAAFHLVDAAGTGAFFVCGALKAEKQDAAALMIPSAPMSATLIEGSSEVRLSFGELFFRKIDEYIRIVESVMELTNDPATRINTHSEAWTAVDLFVRAALEKLGSEAVKFERPDRLIQAGDTTGVQGSPDTRRRKGSQMTKEDVQGIVARTVTQEVQTILQAELAAALKQGLTRVEEALGAVEKITQAHGQAGQTQDPDLRSALDELSQRLQAFESELKTVAKRQESLEHTTVSRPSLSEDPTAQADRSDDYDPAHPSRAFKGMFDQMPL